MRLTLCILLACALCFVLGCSGGNSAGSTPQRTGKATITIKWPTRAAGRTFIPSATQSVVVTLNNGNGFTVSQTINRDPSAATVSYTFTNVPIGAVAVTIQAYDGQNGSGSLLASGTSVTAVADGQTATVTAEMSSDVASVVISPYPSPVKAGQTAHLVATVQSSDGSTILEPAGDIYWTSSDPTTATVDQTGLVTGVQAGTVTITAQERESGVSGTTSLTIAQGSGSLAVVITSNITVTVSPSTPTIAAGSSQQFSASVTDVPNQAVLWSVQEASGGTITPNGLYTAPATPGMYHVVATSIADSTKQATATITVGTPGIDILATVPVGPYSTEIVVNPTNNRAYTINQGDNTMSVLDVCSNAVLATVPVGNTPFCLTVNPTNNKVYVSNHYDHTMGVFDGSTNAVLAMVPVGHYPYGVAVNPTTNRIYIANGGDNTVSVIDGNTNTVLATVPVGTCPYGVTVNPTTNRIYVANGLANTVSVIDGNANTVLATVPVGTYPQEIAMNPTTNKVYVVNWRDNTVGVLDGSANAVLATVHVGNCPQDIAVNPTTNLVYVSNRDDRTISVLDGSANTVLVTAPVLVDPWGVAVNPITNRLYVSNAASLTVSVFQGL